MKICVIGNADSVHVAGRARALAGRGHDVTVVSETPAEIAGIEVRSPAATGGQALGTFRVLLRLAAMLRDAAVDVYLVHYAAGYGPWLAAALGLRPLAVAVIGGDVLPDEQVPQSRPARWLTRELVGMADLVMPASAYLFERVRDYGADPARIIPVVWGVDVDRFRRRDATELRRRLGIAGDAPVVLSPRILRPFYNIHLIIAGFAKAVEDHPRAVLVVTAYNAEPAYEQELKRQAAELGIADRVRFVGRIAAEEMALYYSMAQVSVGVPPSDGMPVSMLEAMACGTPVMVTRLERYEEFVRHGESAWFVLLDVNGIGDALSRILGDEALQERLAGAGRRIVVERANLTKEVARVEQALSKLTMEQARKQTSPRRTIRIDLLVGLAAVVIDLGLARWRRA